MADVNPLPSLRRNGSRTERGQLLAITGLLLAVMIVLLAALLTSVIYAGNIGSQGSDIGSRETSSFERSATSAADELLLMTNNGSNATNNHDALSESFTSNISAWETQANQHVTRDTDYSSVAVTETVNGTQIRQTEHTEFDSAQNETDWQLATDVQVRNYAIDAGNAHEVGLDLTLDNPDPFYINVSTDDPDESDWFFYIYEDSDTGNTTIEAEYNGSSIGECDAGGQEAAVDFSTATVNGEFCEAAIFANGLEPPYTISYRNGGQITGEYGLIVDDPTVEGSANFADPGAGQPHAVSGIYAATMTLRYESKRIVYESTFDIAPRENYE